MAEVTWHGISGAQKKNNKAERGRRWKEQGF